MKRFQDLLAPDLQSPALEQSRASRELPQAVSKSHLCWWKKANLASSERKFLVVVVAPWSNYDLALLDILDETMTSSTLKQVLRLIPVYVANLDQYQTIEQLTEEIPTIDRKPPQTPIVVLWEDGDFRETRFGKLGRDLVAETLGMIPKELNDRVVNRVREPISAKPLVD